MNLTIKQLRVFVAVFEARSFTAAAATLHMTQSAISKICRELEERVACRLFDRAAKTLMPLDSAHVLYRSAQDILASVALAERRLGGLKSMHDPRPYFTDLTDPRRETRNKLQDGKTVVLLLCAGSKSTQQADIAKASVCWNDWKHRHHKAPQAENDNE